jgi:biopolymer transport protein ExbB
MMFTLIAQAAEVAKKAAEKAAEVAPKAVEAATKAGEAATKAGDAAAKAGEAAASAGTPWYVELTNSGAMGYMIEGGIFMWPILFLGILAAGVIIERYRSLKLVGTDNEALRAQVLDMLNNDRVEEALNLCDTQQGPVPAILSVGLRKFLVLRKLGYDAGKIEEQVLGAMDSYGIHIVAALEKHLPILATVASAAPMVGFLGTVQGMVISFDDIVKGSGQKDIVQLAAAGIMVALLTTVFGLVVGIPAFVAFNYFTSVVNRFVLDVEESATELIEAMMLKLALKDLSEGKLSLDPVPESQSV